MLTGDYYCLMDHDDVWHPEKILRQLPVAEKFPVVSTGYRVINSGTNRIIDRKQFGAGGQVSYGCNEAFLQKLRRDIKGQNLYMSTLMIDSRLKNIRFEENFGMVDYDWLLRITENNETAEITGCLTTRFVNPSNLSLNIGYRQKDYFFSLYILENYRDQYPEECTMAIKRLNGTRARYFYLQNNMKEARRFFVKSEFNAKQVGYILTSFLGSRYIKRNFAVFG